MRCGRSVLPRRLAFEISDQPFANRRIFNVEHVWEAWVALTRGVHHQLPEAKIRVAQPSFTQQGEDFVDSAGVSHAASVASALPWNLLDRFRRGAELGGRVTVGSLRPNSDTKHVVEPANKRPLDARELRRLRLFYSVYPQIRETLSPEWMAGPGAAASLAALATPPEPKREAASPTLIHHLSFSHLAELCDLPDDTQRRFYEMECLRGDWSVRELRRQIDSLYYQRSGLSKDKAQLSALAHAVADTLQPAHVIRDPYVFEFLGLRSRDVMAESDLEDALLDRLQDFLLELGHGFCFEARHILSPASVDNSVGSPRAGTATR